MIYTVSKVRQRLNIHSKLSANVELIENNLKVELFTTDELKIELLMSIFCFHFCHSY